MTTLEHRTGGRSRSWLNWNNCHSRRNGSDRSPERNTLLLSLVSISNINVISRVSSPKWISVFGWKTNPKYGTRPNQSGPDDPEEHEALESGHTSYEMTFRGSFWLLLKCVEDETFRGATTRQVSNQTSDDSRLTHGSASTKAFLSRHHGRHHGSEYPWNQQAELDPDNQAQARCDSQHVCSMFTSKIFQRYFRLYWHFRSSCVYSYLLLVFIYNTFFFTSVQLLNSSNKKQNHTDQCEDP